MKQLAGWAGIIAVPTLLAGIWGMNFEYMPELHSRVGYPLAIAVILGVMGLVYWRLRRAGWL
jgi:magnesium transporter